MNKPRNEMTNDAARLVLHSYRPNGVDARDPRFRAALDQAAHDPDLARWFNQQQIFDTFIANKLAEIQLPADFLVLIVAGLETGHGRKWWRCTYILAFAAVLVMSGSLLPYMDQVGRREWLRDLQRANLAMLSSPDLPNQLDLVTDDFIKTQEYLLR
jgi:hypothetical protein